VLKIELRSIDSLQFYFRNPRRNDHAVQQMVASIREYGFNIPLLVRSDGEVIEGHLQLKAVDAAADIKSHPGRELVYDPFLGSGTTLAAAEATERVCDGVELDAKYADVVIQRWQCMAGKTARLEGTEGRSKQWRNG